MKYVICVLILTIVQRASFMCFCGRESPSGTHRVPSRTSWAVAISIRYGHHQTIVCGGSLINDRYVLTAARCVRLFPPQMVGVTLGSMIVNQTRSMPFLPIRDIIIHERYTRFYRRRLQHIFNDVALLRLREPLKQFTPICLPTTDVKDVAVAVSGWGFPAVSGSFAGIPAFSESSVKQLDAPICSRFFRRYLRFDEKNSICASGAVGVCFKDEGSPLIARRNGYVFQTGIVSVSRGFADCQHRPRVPTIFSKVTSHMEWIRSKTTDATWCWTPDQTVSRSLEENEIRDEFKDFKSFNDAKEIDLEERRN